MKPTGATVDDFWGRAYRGRTDHLWRWSDDVEYTTLCGLWQRTREVWKHGLKRCRKCERLAAKEQSSMITYKEQSDFSVRVLLEGRLVGTIRRDTSGWQYRPRGASAAMYGDHFDTLGECKRSLESDDNAATPSTSAGGG